MNPNFPTQSYYNIIHVQNAVLLDSAQRVKPPPIIRRRRCRRRPCCMNLPSNSIRHGMSGAYRTLRRYKIILIKIPIIRLFIAFARLWLIPRREATAGVALHSILAGPLPRPDQWHHWFGQRNALHDLGQRCNAYNKKTGSHFSVGPEPSGGHGVECVGRVQCPVHGDQTSCGTGAGTVVEKISARRLEYQR